MYNNKIKVIKFFTNDHIYYIIKLNKLYSYELKIDLLFIHVHF
jgi:hypothetical protein